MIGRAEIVCGLRRLGIQPGDLVFFHTSIKSFGGCIEDGPNGLIDATYEAVSPTGTIAVPTHGFSSDAPFEPAKAPLFSTLGLLPRVFVARPDARRSLHPTHSDVAIGPDSEWLLEGHERCSSGVGRGSPLDNLRLHPKGKVVLYGVGLDKVTLFHLAENLAPAPYIGFQRKPIFPDVARVRKPDGVIVEVSLEDTPGCADGFVALEPLLRERNLIRETTIGAAAVMAFPAGLAVDVAIEQIRRDGVSLLPPAGHCEGCRRARLQAAG
jgi:aminoglycoside N3'-acetyltransferase